MLSSLYLPKSGHESIWNSKTQKNGRRPYTCLSAMNKTTPLFRLNPLPQPPTLPNFAHTITALYLKKTKTPKSKHIQRAHVISTKLLHTTRFSPPSPHTHSPAYIYRASISPHRCIFVIWWPVPDKRPPPRRCVSSCVCRCAVQYIHGRRHCGWRRVVIM